MELPSFYKIFAKNILRQSANTLLHAQKLSISSKICSLLLIAFTSTANHVSANGIYSHLQLKQDLANFLAEEYRQRPHERIDIEVGNLDSRLRVDQCSSPLTFTAQDQTGLGGNISVKVQCSGNPDWTIYIPAQVMIYREIPVASADILRGQSITNAHVTSALINISNIRQDFAGDTGAVIGREAKRNISKGDAFKTVQLDAPTAVRRGEIVMLESIAGSIKVSSSGTAMSDGRLGQKIRVKNESSERIITGIVKSQGLVQTL